MILSDIKIREANKEDASQIAELLMMAWPVEEILDSIGSNSISYAQLHDFITTIVSKEQTIYSYENTFIALVDGNIVGAMCGYDGADYQRLKQPVVDLLGNDSGFAQLKETEAGEFYLDSVGVLPEYRRRGIASMLFEAQIQHAASLGHKSVGLIVDEDKPQAEALYTRLGFRYIDEKDFFGHKMKHMVRKIMTEKEKMLSGMSYSAIDEELLKELNQVKEVIHRYNSISPSETSSRLKILKGLLGHIADDEIIINQPFFCDYGKQISVGKRFFANFNLTILDEAYVTIGDDCFIGPNVSIYTACHSTDPVERNSRREWAEPVTIGNNVWIGGSVTILPGIVIGNNVTIGAGSVVTKDIPDNVVAVGNPCRVIKNI